jgi:hypothetical protein
MEYREHGPHAALPPGDARIVPLCDLLDIREAARIWKVQPDADWS